MSVVAHDISTSAIPAATLSDSPPFLEETCELAWIFSREGPLAQAMPGYRPRAQQLAMAQAVAHALARGELLVAEAGTGTGKTFAYLAPLLRAGGRAIISTGTRLLQDQLFKRDLPRLRAALQHPVTIALLKGRANYVCPYHMERAIGNGRFANAEEARHIQVIARFAARSDEGERSLCAEVPEDATAWRYATSTRENCLGAECPRLSDCFVMKARKQAMAAELVVVNHHLFFADLWLKDEGAGELLPRCDAVIFDEAHQLPEIASVFFSESVYSGVLIDLARQIRIEAAVAARESTDIPAATQLLDRAIRELRLVFPLDETVRRTRAQALELPAFSTALTRLEASLTALYDLLQKQAERAEALEQAFLQLGKLRARLARWSGARAAPLREATAHTTADLEENAFGEISQPVNKNQSAENNLDTDPAINLPVDDLAAFPSPSKEQTHVCWLESGGPGFQLHTTPILIAEQFSRQLATDLSGAASARARAWIFTSATLAVDGRFDLYVRELGLTTARCLHWASPFDYRRQAALYIPRDLPPPNNPEHTRAVVEAAWPLLLRAQGHALLLFTTLRAMKQAHTLLAEKLAGVQSDYPLLLQGEAPRSELLARFSSTPHAVLLASQGFWEGVDVKGAQLRLLVIDKLPFSPPDDPVLAARIEALRAAGGNPFFEYQVPQAAILLKQGAGRLIRDEGDRGVLLIGDTRLVDKNYGKTVLLPALPRMHRTRLREVAERFLDTVPDSTAAASPPTPEPTPDAD